jgi:putative peptide maturation dehydrogenase
LLAVPTGRWVDESELDLQPAALAALVDAGLVLRDAEDPAGLHARDEALSLSGWSPHAALYHFASRWRDMGAEFAEADPDEVDAAVAELAAQHREAGAEAPPAFHELEAARAIVELPAPTARGPLEDALAGRRTTRAFAAGGRLELEQLSHLLFWTFGCHGVANETDWLTVLRRTSPSGGGLHPIEAYPFAIAIDGLDTGLYHYRARDHALELVAPVAESEAATLASRLAAGQVYFGRASAHVVLTARFERSYWKYRRHDKAYRVLLMDAGHLSQTFYLVAARLGLGAFVTAAINDAAIDELLGLDPAVEGSLAVLGCGVRAEGRTRLETAYEPYAPARF